MSLDTGIYIISSKVEGTPYVGRPRFDDLSFGPKPIVALLDQPGVLPPKLMLDRLPGSKDLYRISVNSGGVMEIEGKLFAVINPVQPTVNAIWRIVHIEGQGDDAVYTINHAEDSTTGWRVPENIKIDYGTDAQVLIGQLYPHPPSGALFTFRRDDI